jgi:hypothetical protein
VLVVAHPHENPAFARFVVWHALVLRDPVARYNIGPDCLARSRGLSAASLASNAGAWKSDKLPFVRTNNEARAIVKQLHTEL